MDKQLLKTSGADVLSSRKKLRKTLFEVDIPHPHPLYVQGLTALFVKNAKNWLLYVWECSDSSRTLLYKLQFVNSFSEVLAKTDEQ